MKRYAKYAKPYLSAFIIGPLLMITEVIGEVFLPKLMSLIINVGIAEKNVSYIAAVGALMALTAVVMMVGGVGGAYFSAKASISFSTDLRRDVFSKIQQFSFHNIDQFSTGSLVTRMTNDIQQVQMVMMMALRMMLRSPGLFIGALIMAISINWRLALIILIVIPVLTCAIVVILRIGFPRFERMQRKLDRLNSGIQEALTNVRVIKSFVREDFETGKFKDMNQDLMDGSLHAMKVVIVAMPVMTLAMNFTTLAVVWYGGNMIIGGGMQVGDLTAFTTYIVQILTSLMMLSMIFLQSSRAMASMKRITEVLDTEIDLNDDTAQNKDQMVEKGKVEFRHVSFRYGTGGKEWVLRDLNFTAWPGQTIGIIGSTGCGKTTMVSLIPRLYDATEGQVLVDDVDVRDYSLRHLRDGVGMVLQKNVLFSGTIEENLLWGDESADRETIVQYAKAAQADEFIASFPGGYETELGQGGVNVSGGQKQRLCIARALLKRPRILILDDSTSAVDTATEGRIQESFAELLQDTTKIIIAQRINSVEQADQIIVMDDGQIIGIGSHEELLSTCQAYQEIYYSQKEKEAVS